ncbi:Putative TauD/TfdA-like domain, gamma-butyrobetaine hydroxylase-like, GBBH-like domain superfamily [Septoria linicola]|uniref:TauD/TfdA-like domain, gamma-butyrobetaine hydroxylase-like, GBBH-like domain superfamily n=1 Tax=Septoria linicola TaxID=215465 RepID=A0A9Q9EK69_9PEZI|nr:Putative TauD/TfdA-like domain, gamma-butyrobetaine hydroxylase-like, GBBH-like domain superfamily [Septoria linicola]
MLEVAWIGQLIIKYLQASRLAAQPTVRPGSIRAVHSQLSPATTSNKVAIPIDGKPVEFSSLVLRDLCQCTACVHESTNQRLYSTAEVPPNIKADEVQITNQEARITWQHDAPGFDLFHDTILPLNTLRRVVDMGARPNPHQAPLESRTLWGAKDPQPPDTTFADYLRDDKALYNVMRQLQQHGLVFITEITHVEEALEKIAKRMVRTVPSAINTAYTSSDLGFHTDLLYFSNPPHIQLLHCIQSSSAGGASVFADAFKSAVELSAQDREAFDVLFKLSVNYHYHHPEDNVYFTTKKVFEFNEEYLRKLKESDGAVTKEDVVEGRGWRR